MTITINIENGIRHGSFDIHGVQGTFPTQVITSTNLNNAEIGKFSPFDFKTEIVEVIEFKPQKLVNNKNYRNKRLKIIKEMINKFPNYLFLFVINGKSDKKTAFKFSRNNNEFLIKFQKQCGFKLIKIFLKDIQNIRKDYKHYRKIIPKKRFVVSLDENIDNEEFKFIYEDCLEHNDEIITFFGRRISENKNNLDNSLNFIFLSKRKNDKILRITSMISRTNKGKMVNSLNYQRVGLDAYSFITNRGNRNVVDYKLVALDGIKYETLLHDTHLICTIKKELKLYESSQYFRMHFKQSSIPVSTHDIIRLNEKFQVLHKEYTRESLNEILDNKD